MKRKIYIQIIVLWLLLLFSGFVANAQNTAKIGDITTLSVSEVSGDTYVWELYDVYSNVNFATTTGNCPTNKAQFVNGNTGASVQVKWLENGEYFYKVTAQNSCANNVKIGRVVVTLADVPPAPEIGINYNCSEGTAVLTALNYTGNLLWSTGETTESITVTEAGVYTLTQTVNKTTSAIDSVEVTRIQAGMPENVMATPPKIEEGGASQLAADGCDGGTLHWYADAALTQEIDPTQVSPKQTTTYYVICENAAGCLSEAIPVTIEVEIFTEEKCKEMYQSITIEQLVTPNNDGKNDTWELNDVLEYCRECGKSVRVKLFNRWGAKVYGKSGYMLDEERFEGYSKNGLDYRNYKKLPDGTYFYIIEVDGEKGKAGFINLVTHK